MSTQDLKEVIAIAAEERRLADVRWTAWLERLAKSWEREAERTESGAGSDAWQHGAAQAIATCAATLRAEIESRSNVAICREEDCQP